MVPLPKEVMNNIMAFKRFTPPLLWMGLIFLVSAQSKLPSAPQVTVDTLLKILAHWIEYLVLYLLWVRTLRLTPAVSNNAGRLAVLISCFYAISDELHQSLVPGRVASVFDLLVDWMGIAAGWWLDKRLRLKLT